MTYAGGAAKFTLVVAILRQAWKNPDPMGIKRLVIVLVIIFLVLGLIVLLLFQTGADEQVINSLLPKVEERLGVDISYKSADTALTSLDLNELEIKSKEGCTYLSAKRLGLSVRVGPLFLGEIDITGVRFDGLEIRAGAAVDGCPPEAWQTLLAALSKRSAPTGQAEAPRERLELLISSGKMRFADNELLAEAAFSGRIGQDAKTVLEVEEYAVSHAGQRLVEGAGGELKFDPEKRHIAGQIEGSAVSLPVKGPELLTLVRDLRRTEQTWREVTGAGGAGTEGAEDSPLSEAKPVAVGLSVKGATITLKAPAGDALPIQDVTVEATLNADRATVLSSSGRLPGTDARFVLQLQAGAGKPPAATLEIPDMSIAQLGKMLYPSEHVDWRHASLDGRINATVEDAGQKILLTGQAAVTDLTIHHEKLAAAPLANLIFNTDFKMEYDRRESLLHLERFLVSTGMARTTLRGDIRLDRLMFDVYLNLPKTACKHIKAALPNAFTTRIRDTLFEGQIAFDMHLAVDEENPEGVILEADMDNGCRIAHYGKLPEPGYFHGPFAYITYDEKGEPLRLVSGPGTDRWVSLAEISPYLTAAVLTTEDGKFWKHKGITLPEIRRAIELNLKKGGLHHGASTITMQLAKNLFLGRERTVSRKLQEVIMVWYLESYFTKEEILELYFNIIEYGPSLYGIKDAAMHYFGRTPAELTPLESVFLIKMLPSPVSRHRIYERGTVSQRQMSVFHRVLRTMRERKRLTDAELSAALSSAIVFHREGDPLPPPRSFIDRDRSAASHEPGEDAVDGAEEEPLAETPEVWDN